MIVLIVWYNSFSVGYLAVWARKTAALMVTPEVWSSSANCWRLLPVVIPSSIIMTSLPMIFGDITMFEADSIALRF